MFDSLTDYELLTLIQQNNEEALNFLFFRYEKLVNCITVPLIKKCFHLQSHYEDLYEQGRISSIEAIKTYDMKKGSFFNYWYNVVYRAVLSELRKIFTKGYTFQLEECSLNDENSAMASYTYRAIDALDIRTDYSNQETIEKIEILSKTILSAFEQKVLKMKMIGYSYGDISKKLNVEIKKIDNTMCGIRKKIRNNIEL